MKKYETLRNEVYDIDALPPDQRRIYEEVEKYFNTSPEWTDFSGFWLRKVDSLLRAEDTEEKREEITETPIFRICQDMESRLGIKQGYVRRADYRDLLAHIIDENFPSRYAFCKEVGIDESFLSHVLKGRKDFSVAKLQELLEGIGYEIDFKKKAAMS